MEKQEFNLSERMIMREKPIDMVGCFSYLDVKEFIKRLKETLKIHERVNPLIIKQIDKLAGDKLVN